MANKIIFLLLIFFISSTITITTATTTTIYDSDGNPIEANRDYFILPEVPGLDGGLKLVEFKPNKTKQCTIFITPVSSKGDLVKFYPLERKQKQINISTDINIAFSATLETTCMEGPVWRVAVDGRRKTVMPPAYVEMGGSIGHPGEETLSNWFKIEKAGTGKYDYKIKYCPSVCKTCEYICGDLGVVSQSKNRLVLAFSDQPVLVKFNKVTNYLRS